MITCKKVKALTNSVFWRLPYRIRYASFKLLKPASYQRKQDLRNKTVTGDHTSLKGFDDLNCIFIHIPKTAGVSINKALFNNLGGGHRTIRYYQLVYDKNTFIKFYKFAFVRNPWDRLVSAYFFLKSGGMHENNRLWFQENLAKFSSFDAFVKHWVNQDNVHKYILFKPQYEFVTIDGRICVDDTYKFENLPKNLECLSRHLGIKIVLPHSNETVNRRQDYREYYNRESRSIVKKVYQQDVELFDYRF